MAHRPFGREKLRHITRFGPADRIQMAEPCEPVQRPRPAFARRDEVERRDIVGMCDGAGEAELTALDLVPEARVGGAQVLGNDEKLLGGRCAELPTERRRVENGRDRFAPQTVRGGMRDPDPFR
ncbi:hypothetical protein, partial [Enterovirga sp.]|uniref:hypothetical protein n=1 Tax=Enterovirga sp. TaxID=2026350 RepID=UPI002C228837